MIEISFLQRAIRGSSVPSGGTESLRGFEFQAWSLIYYFLLRLQEYPDLGIYVETLEDAVLEYPGAGDGPLYELIQCKKREDRGPATLRPVGTIGNISPGEFFVQDLKDWLAHNDLVQFLAGPVPVVFTALLMGIPRGDLKKFQPLQGKNELIGRYKSIFLPTIGIPKIHKKRASRIGSPQKKCAVAFAFLGCRIGKRFKYGAECSWRARSLSLRASHYRLFFAFYNSTEYVRAHSPPTVK